MIQLFKPVYRTSEILKEIEETLNSGWTGDGPKCQKFQQEFADFLGVPDSSVRYLNSATAALHLAVKALDLHPESKIGTTPITFVSTNAAIRYEQHIPYFIDIDPETLTLDPKKVLEAARSNKISAVIWVHYAGSVHPDFLSLSRQLRDLGVHVIEDCAHAAGAFYPGTHLRVGSLPSTISCFSFQAVKNLPTADSGAIVVPDPDQFERVNRLSWLGIDKSTYSRTNSTGPSGSDLYKWKYTVPEVGYKYNPNDIMACIALVQLKYVEQDNAHRKQVHEWYKEFLQNSLSVQLIKHSAGSSHHLTEVVVNDRELAIQKLKRGGFAPGVHYLPNYSFPAFAPYYESGSCPETEKISEHILTVPQHLDIKKEHVEAICSILTERDK